MNFEPPSPDFTKDLTDAALPSRTINMQLPRGNHKFQSPLLQRQQQTEFQKKAPTHTQNYNKFNPLNHGNHNNQNGTVYNRLGPRNSYRPNSGNMNADQNNTLPDNRNFNRKRPGDLINAGPMPPRRKWRSNNRSFYPNTQSNQNINLAQNRLNRIRSNNNVHVADEETYQVNNSQEIKPEPDANESQELDATDITVEVINHNAQVSEDSNLTRFKMTLDPKAQAAIKVIQQKRKDKQVIFPFPVTPNVTGVSLHERFTML